MLRGCQERGLLLLGAGAQEQVIRWMPPLIIDERQLDEAFAIIDRGLEITDRAVAG